MNKWLLIASILIAYSTFGQTPQLATANYAENGQLIGLANLSGLEDCGAANLVGKVKNIKTEAAFAAFELRSKSGSQTIQVNLDRLSERNRTTFFQHLLRKGRLLRVSGYRCGTDEFIKAISIDRSY